MGRRRGVDHFKMATRNVNEGRRDDCRDGGMAGEMEGVRNKDMKERGDLVDDDKAATIKVNEG